MGERAMGIRVDVNKQGWESSDFPILCEICLGDNPYIRMMKDSFGAECKTCKRPYTVFRWKAGTKGRFKQTVICQMCSKIKNCCQTCLYDLQYGLPLQLRDKFMEQKVEMPKSQSNKEYFLKQLNLNANNLNLNYDKEIPELEQIRNDNVNYDRNKPKICSFFQKGECTRDICPYEHTLDPKSADSEMKSQTIQNRFYGKDDPVAMKILNKMCGNIENEIPIPPENPKIMGLFIKDMKRKLSEKYLIDKFGKYGNLMNCKCVHQKFCSFINFSDRQSAENAMKGEYGNINVDGVEMALAWNKARPYQDKQIDQQILTIKPPSEPPVNELTETEKVFLQD